MKRLTEEIWKGKYTYAGKDKSTKEYDLWVDKAIQKLGKLEDLEEQIGCPLDVIATLREHGFYDEYYCYIPPYRICHIDIFKRDITYFDEEMNCFTVKFKDYKKTFWLKEDRSE